MFWAEIKKKVKHQFKYFRTLLEQKGLWQIYDKIKLP